MWSKKCRGNFFLPPPPNPKTVPTALICMRVCVCVCVCVHVLRLTFFYIVRLAFHWRGFGPHGWVKEWCAENAHHSLRPAFHWRGFGPHGRVKEWCAVSAHHSLTQPCGPKPRQWKAGLTRPCGPKPRQWKASLKVAVFHMTTGTLGLP